VLESIDSTKDEAKGDLPKIDVNREVKPNTVMHARWESTGWPKNTFDAIITDPPYKVGIFEKKWDQGEALEYTKSWALHHLPFLKPGAMVASFTNSRNYDLVASGFRQAGYIVRDPLFWIRYSQKISGKRLNEAGTAYTTLKNCVEMICIGQKPPQGTFRTSFRRWGVGGFYFDETQLPYIDAEDKRKAKALAGQILKRARAGKLGGRGYRTLQGNTFGWLSLEGRRPTNLIVLPNEKGGLPSFYQPYFVIPTVRVNSKESLGHETQKRLVLMEWVVKLIVPPGGLLLDPFCGSGTTLEAAARTGRAVIGLDKSRKWSDKARQRLERAGKSDGTYDLEESTPLPRARRRSRRARH